MGHPEGVELPCGRGQKAELARYDARLIAAAKALGIPIAAP
jgi:hypothetical protein